MLSRVLFASEYIFATLTFCNINLSTAQRYVPHNNYTIKIIHINVTNNINLLFTSNLDNTYKERN